MTRIGIISDTHGLVRPEALSFLKGCERIIHAGDIGSAEVLSRLAAIAPVTAVRGNNDKGAWGESIPETELIECGGIYIYALHDLSQLDIDPPAAGVRVVVSGHTHKPLIERRDGITYINPGSAGPRRFKLPIAIGEILIQGETLLPRVIQL